MIARWRALTALLIGSAMLGMLLGGCAELGSLNPAGAEQTIRKAVEKLRAGDDAAATRMFDEMLARRGVKAETFVLVAAACQVARRFDLCAAYAERGLRETPGATAEVHGRLHSLLGSARQQLGDFDRAIESHLAARHLLPTDPAVLNNLAYAYSEAPNSIDRLRDAERLAQEAIDIAAEKNASPSEMAAYLDTLGWAQLKLGKLDYALANLTTAADTLPEETDIMFHLARAYQAIGRNKDAQVLYERMLRTDPKDARAAQALRELGALQERTPTTGEDRPGIRAAQPTDGG
ncbi:MAG: tetratricopeptide repeat protein [Chthonomonadales bacterium]|nr:tetratricopeptide repeat protein [Chthonomonadales bacterium]